MADSSPPDSRSARIDIVDALRGSALLGLFLLHCIEHFEFGGYPENRPAWLLQLDTATRQTGYFLWGGKAYAIFAMMFGLSFFLILDRAAQRGVDFRGRFVWRLCVLAGIGYAFGILYCGEILSMLAVLGLPLALLYKVPGRWLAALSALALLQLPFLYQLALAWNDPAYHPFRLNVGGYYRQLGTVFANEGLAEVCRVNLWTGVQARWSWSIENGRYLQMFGLFLWGLLLGRSRVFEDRSRSLRLAGRVLVIAGVTFAVLLYLRSVHPTWGLQGAKRTVIRRLLSSWTDVSQMAVWASLFVVLYHATPLQKLLRLLAPYGRTSLTCYVTQSLVGMVLFYNFGLGLFRVLGEFYTLLGGIVFFVLQCAAAHLWLRHFHYGPLEWLWRSLTFLSFKTPFRKRPAQNAAPSIANAAQGDPA